MQKLGVCLLITLAFAALVMGGTVYKPTGNTPKIIGYWGCNAGGMDSTMSMLQTSINKGYNVIIYAFYLVEADGKLIVDYTSVPPPVKSSITTNKQFSYLISLFGGQNGAAPSIAISADQLATNMFNNFKNLHEMYGFDGIDIDLENSWGGTGDKVACALRTFFKLMHNAGFVVSMAPQTTAVTPDVPRYYTSSWNSYAPLMDSTIIEYVDIVAIQLYNNAVPYDDAAKYTETLVNGFQVAGSPTCAGSTTVAPSGLVKVPACKLAHGWPSTFGAAPAGCPGLKFASQDKCPYGNLLTTLYAGSSTLRGTAGVMTWSIEWDAHGNWAFINAATAITYTGTSCGAAPPPVAATERPAATAAPATQAPTNKPATAAPATQAPATQAPKPATAAPATQAPATQAPKPATAAPATQAPATQAPKPATAAPTQAATAAPSKAPTSAPVATARPGTGGASCVKFVHTATGSWSDGTGRTVTQYMVKATITGPVSDLKFTIAEYTGLSSIWDVEGLGNGVFRLPQWMYTNGRIEAGATHVGFGYILASANPATITVQSGCL